MKISRPLTARVSRQPRKALSLVEVTISTLLVGLMIVASMKSVGGVLRTWAMVGEMPQGNTLTLELLTEIVQAEYVEPDDAPLFGPESPETGASRADWDDVDDYNGWSSSPPERKDGTAITEYTGWTRTVVAIEYVSPSSPLTVVGGDQGLKRITVRLTDPKGKQTTLVGLRSKLGSVEREPGLYMPYVTQASVTLQAGSSGQELSSGTNLVNHAKDQ